MTLNPNPIELQNWQKEATRVFGWPTHNTITITGVFLVELIRLALEEQANNSNK